MLKFLAAAAVAAVAVIGLPTVSEAGHERGARYERPRVELPKFEHKPAPRDPLFVLAPRQPREHVRKPITLPRIDRTPAPRDPLFVLAPRKPRPAMHMPRIDLPKLRMPKLHMPRVRMPRISLPKFEHTPAPRDPLFVLAPRKPRAAVVHHRRPVIVRSHRAYK